MVSCFSHVRLFATPWTVAYQAPVSNGILQARTLELVAISFSSEWKWKVKGKSLSCAWLTPWTVACQAPLSMGFSRQEYWSGLPFPSPQWHIIWPQKGIEYWCMLYHEWILRTLCSCMQSCFSSVQSLSCVWLFATPWIAARQAFLSITNSRSSLRLTSIELVMPPSHLILCCPLLLLPPIPPSIRVFSNESTLLQ